MSLPIDQPGLSGTALSPVRLDGVRMRPLAPHPDDRGTFTEAFRREWDTGIDPVQWNMVPLAGEPGGGVAALSR